MNNILQCVNDQVFGTAGQLGVNIIEFRKLFPNENFKKSSPHYIQQTIHSFRRDKNSPLKEGADFNYLTENDVVSNIKIEYNGKSAVIRNGSTGLYAYGVKAIRKILRILYKFTVSEINKFIAMFYAKPVSIKKMKQVKTKTPFKFLFVKDQKKQFFVFFNVKNLLNRIQISLLHSINDKLDLLISPS